MSVRRYAAASVALVIVAGGPAFAGTSTPAPAAGSASSGLTLFDVTVGGHQLRVGRVVLTGDTTGSAPAAKVVVTPVTADGTSYGEQTVTPSAPVDVPSAQSPSTVSRLATVKSPAISAVASTADGASARVSAATLGALSVLGLPVKLDGQVSVGSVVDRTGATGEKTLTLRNVALPSIADLLGALGLDLSKLPPATLTSLVERLGLVTDTITAARQALDAALAPVQSQLDAATKTAADAQAAVTQTTATLTSQQAQLAAAQSALSSATSQLQGALPTLQRAGLLDPVTSPLPVPLPTSSPLSVPLPLPTDAPSVPLVSPSPLPSIAVPTSLTPVTQPLVDAYNTATSSYDAALAAVDATTTQLNTLTSILNTAAQTVNSLLAQVQPQVDALVAAVTARLDATPLVSLDSVTVRTRAAATSAAAGGQTAEIVGGEVQGLHVLGTDVLQNVLGSSSVDLLGLADAKLAAVTTALNGVTSTLSSVLSNVPLLPTLSVPAPHVGLLTKSTSTSVSGGFGRASTSLRLLQITVPAITLPAAVALPGASSLPAYGALRAQAVGDLVSSPITLDLGTLTDAVAFRPAAATTSAPAGSSPGGSVPAGSTPGSSVPGGSTPTGSVPTSGVPQLPHTGLGLLLPGLAAMLLGGTWVLRRRTRLPA